MVEQITGWFIDLVIKIFKSIFDVLADFFINAFDLLLSAVGQLVAAIPAPSFLQNSSLSSLINQLPDSVMYFAGQLGIGQALALIASGFVFRMARKLLTLGQW